MEFNLHHSIEILERIPAVLEDTLAGLNDEWTKTNEGGDTWSPYDVIGHLIQGEKTDWLPRMQIILNETGDKKFEKFDRFAQFENSKGKSLQELLNEFKRLRFENIRILKEANLSTQQFDMEGIHPTFGTVTLKQLLSTWVVHDLTHIAQIIRVMAFQYKDAVGPWVEFLGVLKGR